MYKLRTKGGKRCPIINWALPERVFFACGACHILAYAFLKAYPDSGFTPVWIRPLKGYTGNHILVVRDQLAFDLRCLVHKDHDREIGRRGYGKGCLTGASQVRSPPGPIGATQRCRWSLPNTLERNVFRIHRALWSAHKAVSGPSFHLLFVTH